VKNPTSELGLRFASNLRRLRLQADVSQTELAVMAEVSVQSISAWEQGARKPLWESVLLLAEVFGVSVLEFTKELGR
jgi:transcriptional regulator with XRE-family HTH domain